MLAQCLEGAQQQRQALALDGLADEHDPQPLPVGCCGSVDRARDGVHPVGDHAVVPAEEAAPGPRRGLGHGDPHAQAVQHPAGADQVGDAVGDPVVGKGVERADERQACRAVATQPTSGATGSWRWTTS